MLKTILIAAAYSAGAYIVDVPLRRSLTAKKARKYADKKGKPLLNVGAGTEKTALFGPTYYGDVNVDLYGRKDVPHGTEDVVTYADAENLKEFEDGQFGAVFSSHLLEHLPDPQKAISEFLRVCGGDRDAVFIVTPSWWAPHTWLHPFHLWYATDGAGGVRGGELKRIRKEPSETAQKYISLRGMED